MTIDGGIPFPVRRAVRRLTQSLKGWASLAMDGNAVDVGGAGNGRRDCIKFPQTAQKKTTRLEVKGKSDENLKTNRCSVWEVGAVDSGNSDRGWQEIGTGA